MRLVALLAVAGSIACNSEPPPLGPRLGGMSSDVKFASCTSASSTTVDISNTGDAPLHFTATLTAAPIFAVQPTAGTIPPGGTQTLTISGTPPSMQAGAEFTGLLLVDADDAMHSSLRIPVHLDTSGAQLTYDAPPLDFGDLPVGASSTLPLSAKNVGTASADITFPKVQQFELAWAAGSHAVLASGDSQPATVSFRPTLVGDADAEWTPSALNGRLCPSNGPKLHGRGVDGVVGVTPGTIDFGMAPCGGGPGATQTFSIVNVSKTAFNFQAALANGNASLFSFAPSSGVVPPEAKIEIIVAFKGMPSMSPITPNFYGDTIAITTDAPKDQPHAVAVHVTAQGGVLSWTNSTLGLGRHQVGTTTSDALEIANIGNAPVTAMFATTSPFEMSTTSVLVNNGSSAQVAVNFHPPPMILGKDVSLNVTVTANGLCSAAPPAALTAQAYDRLTKIAVSGDTYCGLGATGSPKPVYCWGSGSDGELGDGTNTERMNPAPVTGLGDMDAIYLGGRTACATKQGGVACWGYIPGNGWGSSVPVSPNLFFTSKVAMGSGVCLVMTNNKIWCWGPMLPGNGTTSGSFTPQLVPNLDDVTDAAVGSSAACVVRQTGAVYCWGEATTYMDLGTGNTQQLSPVAVPGINDAVSIVAGAHHFCVQRASNKITCWGRAQDGELGFGTPSSAGSAPVNVANLTTSTMLAGSDLNTYALVNGTAWVWGSDIVGQLGDGLKTGVANVPQVVPNLGVVTNLAASGWNAVAVLSDGTIRRWGYLFYGNSLWKTQPPVTVPGLD